VFIHGVLGNEIDVSHLFRLANPVRPVLGLQAYLKVKAVAVVDDRMGRCERQTIAAGTWVANKKSKLAVGVLEVLYGLFSFLLLGVAVVSCHGCHAIFFLQRQLDVLDVPAIVRSDNCLAVSLFKHSHKLVDSIAGDVNLLAIVKLDVTTTNLMQPHELGQGIVGAHQVAINKR
jgi:hypothetical protein